MHDLLGTSREKLADWLSQQGANPIHSVALFKETYKKLNLSPHRSGFFPKASRPAFAESFRMEPLLSLAGEQRSPADGSVKFQWALRDGEQIESVLMPETGRITLCLSSQVGCRQGCVFCHTGRMGLIRNLSAAEIVAQVWQANLWLGANPAWLKERGLRTGQTVSNLVFMGMGEPLDNLAALSAAVAILTDTYGFYLPIKKIAVSTAGHLTGIKALLRELPGISLAFSLHTPFDKERSKLLPINRRFPLTEVVATLKEHFPTDNPKGAFVLVQYTLIKGVNDSLGHAEAIRTLFAGVAIKLNIIPLNPIAVSPLSRPDQETLDRFKDYFYGTEIRALVRISKGQDILAACGQLITATMA